MVVVLLLPLIPPNTDRRLNSSLSAKLIVTHVENFNSTAVGQPDHLTVADPFRRPTHNSNH